jgi:hypothetical protein
VESDALTMELSAQCCGFADAMPKQLSGIRSGQRAWHLANSIVIKSPNQHLETAPSTRNDAPLKLHNTHSPSAEPLIAPLAQR